MPYLTVSTNAEIYPGAEKQFLKEASLAVAVGTGKPEQYVMVKLEAAQSMVFAGSNEPAAFVELKSIGYPASGVEKIAAALCTLVANHLHVPSSRIFTVFHDVKASMWGQGGGIFG